MNSSAKKVAFNSFILYCRLLMTFGVTLLSTRIILKALGNSDFGIFNLIAGIILMLSFLNTAMGASTQRFLSFYQGGNDFTMQKKVFRHSFLLHFFIGLILVGVLQILGLYFFESVLNIPQERMDTAKVVFQLMSLAVFFSVLSVPFNALLMAHENMLWVALVDILEKALVFGVALLLVSLESDKLLMYGKLTTCISFITCLAYGLYCAKNYEECSFAHFLNVDRRLFMELTNFAGWNLFGSLCTIGRAQGIAILFNLFMGVTVNAAYGLANQIGGQLNFLSVTLLRAINPQIMKSEGAGDRSRMLRLSMIASKFSFFLLALVAIPFIFEVDTILELWLDSVPAHTGTFCSLILISCLMNQLTVGVQSALQATGEIKLYQSLVGSVILMNVPTTFLLLKIGFNVDYVLVSFIFIECVACLIRLALLKRICGLSFREYSAKVLSKEVVPVFCAVLVCFLHTRYFGDYSGRFIFTFLFSSLSFVGSVYVAGLTEDEKNSFKRIFIQYRNRLTVKSRFSI